MNIGKRRKVYGTNNKGNVRGKMNAPMTSTACDYGI